MDSEKLIELFLKFPGIGPRQAKRFVYFLAGENKNYVDKLAELILEIKSGMRQCERCLRYYEEKNGEKTERLCGICSSPTRDNDLIMIMEKDVDLENIERMNIYNGKYFVLGGLVSLNGNEADEIRLKQLYDKAEKEKPKEIILATSATAEGENTNLYIERIIEPLKIKISRLGRGLSTGAELEYSDAETIENALQNRK